MTKELVWPVIEQSFGAMLIEWGVAIGIVLLFSLLSFLPLFWGPKRLPIAIGLLLVLLPLGILKAKKVMAQREVSALSQAKTVVKFQDGMLKLPSEESWVVDKSRVELLKWRNRVSAGVSNAYFQGLMIVIKLSDSRKFVLWSEGDLPAATPTDIKIATDPPGFIADSNNRLQLHTEHLLAMYVALIKDHH